MLDFSCLTHYEWLDLPVWVFDADGSRMAWGNQAALAFWHCDSLPSLLQRDFSELSEGTRTRLLLAMQAHARGEINRESWTLYPQGVPVTTMLVSRGIRLDDGRAAILFAAEPLVVGLDATKRRGVEAIAHTSVRIALHDLPSGKVLMRNPAAAQAFGAVVDDNNPGAPNKSTDDFSPMFTDPAVAARIVAQLKKGQTFSTEMELNTLQGQRWHGVDIRPVVDPVTGERAMQINARDIADLKAAQRALETALQAADNANMAKTSFLANMSHEIRTPMNGVLGLTELVLHSELTDKQRHYIELAHQSAQGLMVIINDLLDVAKIESGRMQLEEQALSLQTCLDECLLPLQVQANRKGVRLFHRVSSNVPDTVLGDAGRLRQVLINLVGNALKFTEQGEVKVEVSVEEPNEASSHHPQHIHLRFSVHDTGIGMSQEQTQRVFEPFTQADSSITRRYGGTGLGLTIVSRLVALMQGQVQVRSQLGAGSTFEFTARLRLR
ncbi:MAG: ATP-binding protein [Burkholderiales bacterium]